MIILVRHGQTAANAESRLQGRIDPPLTDVGQAQAAALSVVVGGAARVVSSPLRRARETAAYFDRPVVVDERWSEIDYGELDGLALAEVSPDVWRRWRTDSTWAPEGGESLDDVGRRVAAACEELIGLDEDVVVVSHVTPIKAAVAWALGVPQVVSSRMFLGLASVSRIDKGPVLRTYNETAHLH